MSPSLGAKSDRSYTYYPINLNRTKEPDSDATKSESVDFEAAQRDLFAAVGLDTRSWFIDLETPEVRTHVFEAGPTNDHVPLVPIHGTAAFGALFASLMAQFDDSRMIAVGRPGYGLSDAFVYTEGNLQRTVVDGVEEVLNESGVERADLVGHSMSGHKSILTALAYPERIRRISLVGTVPGFPGTRPSFPLKLLTVPLLGQVIQ